MIFLGFNDTVNLAQCAVSGRKFKPGTPLAFFLNGNKELPVSESVAFKKGFTISKQDFEDLQAYVFDGMTEKELPF
ncbi:MAG: hypothetical protein ACE5KZ_15455 [Candidatus Scalinduaceae bacterium]